MKELFFEDNLMRYIDPADVLCKSVRSHSESFLSRAIYVNCNDDKPDDLDDREEEFNDRIRQLKDLKIKVQYKKASNIRNFKAVIKQLNVEELHEMIERSGDSEIADWKAELIMESISRASIVDMDIYFRWIELECYQREELKKLLVEGLYPRAEEDLERLLKRVGKLILGVAIAKNVQKEGEFITMVRSRDEDND